MRRAYFKWLLIALARNTPAFTPAPSYRRSQFVRALQRNTAAFARKPPGAAAHEASNAPERLPDLWDVQPSPEPDGATSRDLTLTPRQGGPLALWRVLRANGMLRPVYLRFFLRQCRLKLRYGKRIQFDGLAFVAPQVSFGIGRNAVVKVGRWSWIGDGSAIEAHADVEIGAKTVIGRDCTITSFRHISIGPECIVAHRVVLVDFAHGTAELNKPIRLQGIWTRDVRVGRNVWLGHGVFVGGGATIGDNSVVEPNSVVTSDVPTNAVVVGVPARIVRMRDAPSHRGEASTAQQAATILRLVK